MYNTADLEELIAPIEYINVLDRTQADLSNTKSKHIVASGSDGALTFSKSTLVGVFQRKQKKLYTCFYCEFSVEKFKYIKSHIKRFHIIAETSCTHEYRSRIHLELTPNVPRPLKEDIPSISVLQPEPNPNSTLSQTKKFDMDLCPYCDFSDKIEKKLRHHILSKHSKELDKIIIYNYESDKNEQKSPSKALEITKRIVERDENLPESFSTHSIKSVTIAHKRKNCKPSIKRESDKNQNDIIPFTIQPDIDTITLNNISSAKERNDFKCPNCSYCTSEAWDLMCHISQSHPEDVASQESTLDDANGLHKETKDFESQITEMPDKTYYCDHCKYTTHRAQLLNRHLLSKHSDRKPHRCHVCDYATKRMEHLNRHILSKHSGERPFPCRYCNYRASRDDHLRNHVLSKHAGEQLLRCVHCGYSALSTEHLNIHVLTKHSDLKQFMCQKCDFSANLEEELTEHISRSHLQSEPFSCELCPYSTSRLEHLNRHTLAVHSAERPYRCKLCDYSAARSEHLNYHLMSKHRDERPHVCSECDYRATRLSHLTRHIQSKHSGVKPFLCLQCDYRAGRMEHLQRHILARHSDSSLKSEYSPGLLDGHLLSGDEDSVYGQFCDLPIKAEQMDCDIVEQT